MARSTIRADSLNLVQRMRPKARPPSYRSLARLRGEALAYHAVRGYWIVRFLEEAHPGFVRSMLSVRQPRAAIERRVAERLSLPPENLWRDIEDIVFEWFQRQSLTTA
ncbi:MAG TPA: hypothetical protein VFI11_14815 [Anaerolineales bacterium]|nr:hypothetical protein [Anaerolineales bacterium]